MKTKTLLELLTLSSSLYVLARDTQIIDKLSEFAEKGKEHVNGVISESETDEDGNEMEFIDKIIHKTNQVKEELEEKIEELVVAFYKKMHIAHLDEIKALNEKLDKADISIALIEARLNHLERKK